MYDFIKQVEQKYPADYMFGCRGCVPIRQDLREACRHLKQLQDFLKGKVAIAKVSADNENYCVVITIKEIEQALKETQ